MYGAMLQRARPRALRHLDAAALRLRRRGDAGRADARLRAGLRLQDPRGLRPLRDLAGRVVQPSDRERKPGSIGTPIAGVEMKIVDDSRQDVPTGEVGEIVIRGHNVMKGYWRRPDATAEAIRDGWFHTGDLARVDEDGYFFIVDRKKDMIIRNGFNVYPREIEEVLYEHPAVREAAVIGVPHDEYGEEIGAAVSLKDGAIRDTRRAARVRQGAGGAFKYPRRSGSSTTCRRDRPARSSSARSSVPSREVDRAAAKRRACGPRRRSRRRADLLADRRAGRVRARARAGRRDAGVAAPAGCSVETPAAEAVIAEVDGEAGRVRAVPRDVLDLGVPAGHLAGGFLRAARVPPPRRRRRAALATSRAIAVDRGYTRLSWAALDWNELALGFYRKLGADVLDEWKMHRLSGETLARWPHGRERLSSQA